jgi:preprotein translocase subunit SecB
MKREIKMTDRKKASPENETDPNTPSKTFAVVNVALKYARIEISLPAYSLFQGQEKQEKPEWSPKVDTEIQSKTNPIKDNRHEASLTLLLTGKTQQGQSIFQIKLEQNGIFELKGFTLEEETLLLRGHAMSQIYPYASARVNELLIHAGFPPINMNPIDFVGLSQQQQRKEKEGDKSERSVESDKTVLDAAPLIQ